MKKNVVFSPLFLYNLALITHDATMSVNPSIVDRAFNYFLRIRLPALSVPSNECC